MSRRRVSNPLALAVLACLSERPMHPYEISTTLRTRQKEESIRLNYGSLYSVVEALTRHGLISARETTREGRRPERTVYEITTAGREEFEDWLAELLSTPVREFSSLEAGLTLMAGLPPDDVVPLLKNRIERLRVDIAGLDGAASVSAELALPELFWIEAGYRRAMLAAELAFVADLVRRITDETFGGTALWRRMFQLRDQGVAWDEILADPVTHLGEEARALAPQRPRP